MRRRHRWPPHRDRPNPRSTDSRPVPARARCDGCPGRREKRPGPAPFSAMPRVQPTKKPLHCRGLRLAGGGGRLVTTCLSRFPAVSVRMFFWATCNSKGRVRACVRARAHARAFCAGKAINHALRRSRNGAGVTARVAHRQGFGLAQDVGRTIPTQRGRIEKSSDWRSRTEARPCDVRFSNLAFRAL